MFEEMINTIQLGDCYELIKKIPDKSIDCVYVDVPYLLPNSRGKGGGILGERFNQGQKELKTISEGINYEILEEFKRITKKMNCFIWCNKFMFKDILNFIYENNYKFELLIWEKTNPFPMTRNVWLGDCEYCFWIAEKGIVLNDGIELKKKIYTSSINQSDKDKFNHPTIKPLELVKRHILHSTQPDDIVLDCFCGSGTTCVAAKETGRRYIGMEIDPEYHKIAVDRLNGIEASGQTTIFTNFSQLGENND